MKHLIILIAFTLAISAYAQEASGPFSGNSWRVNIVRGAGTDVDPACMTFHTGGNFVMSDRTMTMFWKKHPAFSRIFMALTHNGEHSVTPYQQSVHGFVTPDKKILMGAGVDEYGRNFAFIGKPVKNCPNEPVRGANHNLYDEKQFSQLLAWQGGQTTALQNDFKNGVTGGRPRTDLGALIVNTFQSLVNPCSISWCGPVIDPLRNMLNATTLGEINPQLVTAISANKPDPADLRSRIEGGLFSITVATADNKTLHRCWYFGPEDKVQSNDGATIVWKPDDTYTSSDRGFHSVGTDLQGGSLAYQGALLTDKLLYVQGIEASGNTSYATYGFGTAVDSCPPEAHD